MSGEPREFPMLFNGGMVRAILDGRKTVTRRVFSVPTPDGRRAAITSPDEEIIQFDDGSYHYRSTAGLSGPYSCPYGQPGDWLWVRETWAAARQAIEDKERSRVLYRADPMFGGVDAFDWKWRPSIHMPRWACRLTLEITDVRVERLREITEEDAMAEGMEARPGSTWQTFEDAALGAPPHPVTHRHQFAATWDAIYAARGYGWDANPWIWRIGFRLLEAV